MVFSEPPRSAPSAAVAQSQSATQAGVQHHHYHVGPAAAAVLRDLPADASRLQNLFLMEPTHLSHIFSSSVSFAITFLSLSVFPTSIDLFAVLLLIHSSRPPTVGIEFPPFASHAADSTS